MKIVPGAMASKNFLFTRCLVSGVEARCTLTASATVANSSGEAA